MPAVGCCGDGDDSCEGVAGDLGDWRRRLRAVTVRRPRARLSLVQAGSRLATKSKGDAGGARTASASGDGAGDLVSAER